MSPVSAFHLENLLGASLTPLFHKEHAQSLEFEPFALPSASAAVHNGFQGSTGGLPVHISDSSGSYSGSKGPELQPQRMVQHQPSHSLSSGVLSSISPSMSASAVGPRSDLTSTQGQDGHSTAESRLRAQRLDELSWALNEEIASAGVNSARAMELQGRIAELTRQDEMTRGYEPMRRDVLMTTARRQDEKVGGGEVRSHVLAPPAYERI
jgi:hypothetical protein